MTEDPELNRLLNGLLEGSLDPAETGRVRALLQSSPQARQDYYDLVAVELLLAERYEMPDHIAMQAQLMEEEGVLRPDFGSTGRRAPRFVWAGAGIAAAVAVSWTAFSFFHTRQRDISVVVSPDAHYTINGSPGGMGILKGGDTIDVTHGVVSLSLNSHVEATLEGPATLVLGDREGRVDLKSGSAFFTVTGGGNGFEVHSPAGIIRDIGTKFGVNAKPGGEVETSVDEGKVQIERGEGNPAVIPAGYAASWSSSSAVVSRRNGYDSYVRALPDETELLIDAFDDTEGVSLDGKAPQVGQKWKSEGAGIPTTKVKDSAFDISGGGKSFSANFAPSSTGSVYILTFSTKPPVGTLEQAEQHDAQESLSLRDSEGKVLVSVEARASRGQTWQLRDGSTSQLSKGTRLSAVESHSLTLTLDVRTGVVRLYDGNSCQGEFLDELKLGSVSAPGSLLISSDQGGSLAVDNVAVRMVTYSR